MTYAYICLGANLCRPQRQVHSALRLLRFLPSSRLSAVSPLYISAPVGCVGNQPQYCNAVAELQTRQTPRQIHKKLIKLEKSIQQRRRRRNAPRLLDIDYLLHGMARFSSPRLTLPHPRMEKRAFVLRPLADIVGKNFSDNGRIVNGERLRRGLLKSRSQQLYSV